MKTLRRIGIFLLVFLVILLIISFFLPSKVHVERVAVINAQPEIVFKQVNNLRNWNNWMPWNRLDPNIKIKYYGPEEGVGSGYSWSSENEQVGKGKLSITESKPNESVTAAMNFTGNNVATGTFYLETVEGKTKITWGMDMEMGMNPVAKYVGLFMDQMIGADFEQGLTDLKKVSESYFPPVTPELNATPADSAAVSKPS